MITINNITVSYTKKQVLHGVSLDISDGEFTFIIGPNGSGKSTLLKSINHIKAIDSGEICVNGQNITGWDEKALARQIAFIPQEFHLQFDYTVFEFLLMARYPWLDFLGRYGERDYAIVEQYLEQLDLVSFRHRFYNSLSGGEKQRVLIARALVQDTSVLLMDESLSSLDINHQIEILRYLQGVNGEMQKTIVLVSHNLNLSAEFAKRLVVLKGGLILATGDVEQVYTGEVLSGVFDMAISMIENPYTGIQNIVYRRDANCCIS